VKDRRVIYKETLFVLAGSLVLSLVMELVFLLFGRWRPAVLYGNLLTVFATTLNFYLMCLSLTRALAQGGDEKSVQARMKASSTGRMLLLGLIVAGGCYASVKWDAVDLWATLIPLLFVRVTLFVRSRIIGCETPAAAAPGEGTAGNGAPDDTAAAAEPCAAADPADGASAPDTGTEDPSVSDAAPAEPQQEPSAAPFRTDRRGRPVPPPLSEILKGGEPDDE